MSVPEGEQIVKLVSSDNIEIETGMHFHARELPHARMLTISQSARLLNAAC